MIPRYVCDLKAQLDDESVFLDKERRVTLFNTIT